MQRHEKFTSICTDTFKCWDFLGSRLHNPMSLFNYRDTYPRSHQGTIESIQIDDNAGTLQVRVNAEIMDANGATLQFHDIDLNVWLLYLANPKKNNSGGNVRANI